MSEDYGGYESQMSPSPYQSAMEEESMAESPLAAEAAYEEEVLYAEEARAMESEAYGAGGEAAPYAEYNAAERGGETPSAEYESPFAEYRPESTASGSSTGEASLLREEEAETAMEREDEQAAMQRESIERNAETSELSDIESANNYAEQSDEQEDQQFDATLLDG